MKFKYKLSIPVIFIILLTWSLIPDVASAASLTVNTADDIVNSLDGKCSLREAIIAANTNTVSGVVVGECSAGSDTETDTITLESGSIYLLSIAGVDEDSGATGDLDILDNTTELDIRFVVADDGTATIEGDDVDRVLHIIDASVEFNDVNLIDGDATIGSFTGGGVVLNDDGILTMNGGEISKGTAATGGGIYNYNSGGTGGKVTLNDTQVVLNVAQNAGGAVLSGGSKANLSMNGAIVRANTTAGDGAGIALAGGTAEFITTTISLNTADNDGGGIYAVTTVISITDSLIQSNKALSGSGGGLALDNDSTNALTLSGSTFSTNTAGDQGGAIYTVLDTNTLEISDSDFVQNSSEGSGGAISGTRVTVDGGLFEKNTSTGVGGSGGAIFASITAKIYNVTFKENTASSGGAIRSQFVFGSNNWFEGNESTSNGGAIYLSNRFIELSDSTFYLNTAGQNGGAIYQFTAPYDPDDPAYVVNSVFHMNNADVDGGALWTNTSIGLNLANSTVSMNTAAGNGGGIFIASTGLLTATNITMNLNFAGLQGTAIFKEGEMVLQNTIIGPHNADDCVKVATPFISLGNNLSAADNCDLDQSTDLVNTDPLLGVTQDNGGPTWTAALLTGSPALNAGNDSACASGFVNGIDQRGFWRLSPCDIGAFEQSWAVYLPLMIK